MNQGSNQIQCNNVIENLDTSLNKNYTLQAIFSIYILSLIVHNKEGAGRSSIGYTLQHLGAIVVVERKERLPTTFMVSCIVHTLAHLCLHMAPQN